MCGVRYCSDLHRHARETEPGPPGIRFEVADGMSRPLSALVRFSFRPSMSLMDMPDHGLALKEAYRCCAGRISAVSILHPCFAPPYRKCCGTAMEACGP